MSRFVGILSSSTIDRRGETMNCAICQKEIKDHEEMESIDNIYDECIGHAHTECLERAQRECVIKD